MWVVGRAGFVSDSVSDPGYIGGKYVRKKL